MAAPRWALVGGIVTLVALAGLVLAVALTREPACVALVVERLDAGAAGAVPLDEARVRGEAPQLAALLDRAAAEGRAVEAHEGSARAMRAYLDEAAGGAEQVAWGGASLEWGLDAC